MGVLINVISLIAPPYLRRVSLELVGPKSVCKYKPLPFGSTHNVCSGSERAIPL